MCVVFPRDSNATVLQEDVDVVKCVFESTLCCVAVVCGLQDKRCLHGIVGDTMRSCWTQRVSSEDEWRGECDGREGRVK